AHPLPACSTTLFYFFFLHSSLHLPHLHSFPTRRSSDLTLFSHDAIHRHPRDHDLSVPEGFLCKPYTTSLVPSNSLQNPEEITDRSEEHTSELQSLRHLVCRLLLEKKKKKEV